MLRISILLTSEEQFRAIDFPLLTFELASFELAVAISATLRDIVRKFFRLGTIAGERDSSLCSSPHLGPLLAPARRGRRSSDIATLRTQYFCFATSPAAAGRSPALLRLRESPDFKLCQLSEKKPGLLEELVAERTKLLEKESVESKSSS